MHTSSSRRIAISVLTGLVFLIMGILETINAGALGLGSGAALLLGAAIAVTGTVVGRQPPPKLDLQPGERVLFQSHPSMKPALALIVAGILFFLARIFLMAPAGGGWPIIRYAPLALGVILCSWGIWRYWITHCTAYYATNRRVVRMYRLLGGNSLRLSDGRRQQRRAFVRIHPAPHQQGQPEIHHRRRRGRTGLGLQGYRQSPTRRIA